MAAVVLRAHRPQGRHVLWHTEAEVERRASVVFPVILGELLARPGVVAIEQLLDIFFLDHAGEAKREGRVIQVPRPRAFTPAGVIARPGQARCSTGRLWR